MALFKIELFYAVKWSRWGKMTDFDKSNVLVLPVGRVPIIKIASLLPLNR